MTSHELDDDVVTKEYIIPSAHAQASTPKLESTV